MPDTYVNPFTIQQNNAVPSNPFWSGMVQGQTERQAQPFIGMAQQSQGLDLQKKQIETGEFADPRSVAARMTGQDLTTAQNQSKTSMVPVQEDAERRRIAEEIRALPDMTNEKIEKARLATMNAKGAPQRELFSELGSLYEPMSQAKGEQEKAFLYLGAINRWEQTHPGIKLPDNLRNYSPGIESDIAAIRHAQIYTTEQVGKERVGHITGQYGQQREETQQGGANYRAEIAARAHMYGADKSAERVQGQETPPKAVARLRRELSQNPDQPEKMDEYRAHLEDQWQQQTQRDPGLTILRIRSLTAESPQEKQQAQKQYDQMRNQFFGEKGIYLDAPESGTVKAGKDGKKYRYKGGFGRDWRDRKNWETVE